MAEKVLTFSPPSSFARDAHSGSQAKTLSAVVEPRPVGRPPKQLDQRQRILQQAAKAIATVGYEQCSLADIAAELELTRPALYHYFATKQEIFSEIALATAKGTYEYVASSINEKSSARDSCMS